MIPQLILDGRYKDKQHGALVYALNKVLSENGLQNQPGFDVASSISNHIIGIVTLENKYIYFAFDSGVNIFSIYIGDENDNQTLILATVYSAFTASSKITGEATFNYKGDIIAVFSDGTDGTSVPWLINLTDLPFKSGLNGNKELNDSSEIVTAYLFPEYDHATFSFEGIRNGRLESGSYSIFSSYQLKDDAILGWTNPSEPIPIYEQASTQSYAEVYGCDPGTVTNKSIKCEFTNIDTRYPYFLVGVIAKINNVTVARYKKFPINNSSMVYNIVSLDEMDTIEVTDILTPRIRYDRIKCFTKVTDKLAIGNLKTKADYDYQPLANAIQSEFELVDGINLHPAAGDKSYSNEIDIILDKSFMPNEVYAFYIQLHYIDGTLSRDFHIPGREISTIDIGGITRNEDAAFESGGGDTSTNIDPTIQDDYLGDSQIDSDVRYYQTRCTADKLTGQLGYWANKNETYPDHDSFDIYELDPITNLAVASSDTLRGEPVRHHKMPSIRHLDYDINGNVDDELYAAGWGTDDTKIIKVKFSNILIPADLYPYVKGFTIKYAERSFANSTILGVGSLHGTWQIGSNSIYPLPYMQSPYSNHLTNYYLFHNFELMKYKPGLNARFITNEVYSRNHSSEDDTGFTNGNHNYAMYTYTLVNQSAGVKDIITVKDHVRKLNTVQYIPSDNSQIGLQNDIFNNTGGKSAILLSVETTGLSNIIKAYNPAAPPAAGGQNEVVISTLNILQDDCYNSFVDQDLISSNYFDIDPNNGYVQETGVCSGDVYHVLHNYVTSYDSDVPINAAHLPNTYYLFRTLNVIPTFSPINLNLRHEGDGIINGHDSERLYPILGGDCNELVVNGNTFTSKVWRFLAKSAVVDNYYGVGNRGYNADYSSLNDLKITDIYNPIRDYITDFPNRVHLSLVNANENASLGWRIFPAANYKEFRKDRGAIRSLNSRFKILYTQLENSLFISIIKDQLLTSGANTYLGDADIFDSLPDEIMDGDYGYIGCKSQFGSIVCPAGYIVVDNDLERMYIVPGTNSNNVKRLELDGVNTWFDRYIKTDTSNDNPYISDGITLGYDDKFDMLFLSVKNGNSTTNNFTLSYSFKSGKWLSFHTPVPSNYFSTRKGIYSIVNHTFEDPNGVIYKHNAIGKPCTFYKTDLEGTQGVYDDVIDVIFHSMLDQFNRLYGAELSKIFTDLNFITDVYDVDGNRLYDETVTSVMIYNESQCSNVLTKGGSDWFNKNFRVINNSWYANKFRDIVIDKNTKFLSDKFQLVTGNLNTLYNFHDKSVFVGKYIVVRLTHNNDDNNTIFITRVVANYEKDSKA